MSEALEISLEDIHSIDRLIGALDYSIEDMNKLEHFSRLVEDRNIQPHHLTELKELSGRYGTHISVEGYMAVSTEGFLDVLKSMFSKIAQWTSQIFTKTSEKVQKVTAGEPPKAEDVKKTDYVESILEKLIKLDSRHFSKLERLKASEVIAGKHDEVLLKEFDGSQDDLKACKTWATKLNKAWNIWSSILVGGRDVSHGEWVIGMAVRELKHATSKGILSTDGAREALNKNFLIPRYMLEAGMVDKIRDGITHNAKVAKKTIDDLIMFAKHLPEDASDALRGVSGVCARYQIINLHKLTGDKNIEIDDTFVNKYLAPLVTQTNDILNVMKVKVDREVLSAIKPFTSGTAAMGLLKELDEPFKKRIEASEKSQDKQSWESAENALVRELGHRAKDVVRFYARYIKEMLYLQRFARQYIKLCKTLESLELE